ALEPREHLVELARRALVDGAEEVAREAGLGDDLDVVHELDAAADGAGDLDALARVFDRGGQVLRDGERASARERGLVVAGPGRRAGLELVRLVDVALVGPVSHGPPPIVPTSRERARSRPRSAPRSARLARRPHALALRTIARGPRPARSRAHLGAVLV